MLGIDWANERRRYIVMSSPIGLAHTPRMIPVMASFKTLGPGRVIVGLGRALTNNAHCELKKFRNKIQHCIADAEYNLFTIRIWIYRLYNSLCNDLRITSHHNTSYHITSDHITSHHISHHITSHHITSYHIISYVESMFQEQPHLFYHILWCVIKIYYIMCSCICMLYVICYANAINDS